AGWGGGDRQSELLVQSRLDVRAAVLGAPAEPDELADGEIEVAEIAPPEGNRGSGIRRVVGLVGARGQTHAAREAPEPVRLAARVRRPQVLDGGACPGVGYRCGCRP